MKRLLLTNQDSSQYECKNVENLSQNRTQNLPQSEVKFVRAIEISNHQFIDQYLKSQKQKQRRMLLMKQIHSQSSQEQDNTISVRRQKVKQQTNRSISMSKDEENSKLLVKKLQIMKRFNNSDKFLDQNRKRLTKIKGQLFVVDEKLVSSQQQIKINEQIIFFPYQPYEVQNKYMQSVLEALQNKNNALLQSPTGTGKTLCLLASVLSWVQNNYLKNNVKTKVIYMSRTHSQLKQISKQLQKTCYRPTMAIFGSRQQLCIKKELSQLKGKQKIQACSRGIKLQKRLAKTSGEGRIQDPKIAQAACCYHKQKEEVVGISKRRLVNMILDIDTMKRIGEQEQFCPYFYPSNAKNVATLFIMPYNYLLDSYLLPNYKQIITDSIIIFDEAHNVAQASCEGRSLILESSNLENAILEINHIFSAYSSSNIKQIKQTFEKQLNFILRNLQDYKENLRKYGQELFQPKQDTFRRESFNREQNQTKVINKEKTQFNIFQMFCGNILKDEKKIEFFQKKDYYKSQMKNYLINPLNELIQYGGQLIQALKETPDGYFNNFQKFLAFASKIRQLITPAVFKDRDYSWADIEINHFRLHITQDSSNSKNFTFGLKCLVPWLTFQSIQNLKPRSIILTSGTLKPLELWQKELQMKFATKLSNKHVIKQQQINCKVVSSGPSKVPFLFTFDNLNRNKDNLYKDLIDSIVGIAKKVPNGVLLVFPSFRLQNDFKFQLFRSPKREKLLQYKEIIFEQKSMDTNMQQFKKKAYSSKGVILAMICRGKLSEGIDFPDQLCRAVIMVGIPYPNIKDPFIIQKKNHLQYLASQNEHKSKCLRGQQWYLMGTIRSLNQALGRVIRHVNDYGMIFLFDKRFQENKFNRQLPQWIYKSMQNAELGQQNVDSQINEFFNQMKLKFRTKNEIQNEENISLNISRETEETKKQQNAFHLMMKNRQQFKKQKKGYDFL